MKVLAAILVSGPLSHLPVFVKNLFQSFVMSAIVHPFFLPKSSALSSRPNIAFLSYANSFPPLV
jgi:antibiotic biosynthesis monooxygenase (ABM) superfamily enzyme